MIGMGWDAESDEVLIEAANGGESAAFTALYDRHRLWVLQVAWRRLRDHDLALDVLQEVFGYWATQFPGFRLTCPLRGYLYSVVRFRCQQVATRHGRRVGSLDAIELELSDPQHDANSDDPDGLTQVLARLPEGQREVLRLRFVDDLSLAEIAAALSIPEGTVKSRIHLALAKLREHPLARRLLGD